MNLNVKKIAMTVCGVAMLGGGGWFVWQDFLNDEPLLSMPPAEAAIRPAPVLSAETSTDALIDRIIMLSGLQKQIDDIGNKLLQDIHQSPDRPDDPAVIREIDTIVMEAFRPWHFHQRLREAFRKDFDRERMDKLLQSFSTPLLRKITEIEGREFDLEVFEAFVEGAIRIPLPDNRLRLLQALESVTRTTEFAIELTVGMKRALVMGMTAGDTDAMIAFEAGLNAQKAELTEKMYPAMLLTMAYAYQELNDMELDAYVAFYLTEEGEWFISQALDGLIGAFRAGSLQTGQRIAALVKVKKTRADSPLSGASPAEVDGISDNASAAATLQPLAARSRLDARKCLSLTGNRTIARCAEHYR